MRAYKLAIATTLLIANIAAAARPAPTLTDAERTAVSLAAQRGTLLHSYDQAAWHGTDDMLAKIDRASFRSPGWIVDGPADSPQLIFFDGDAAHPHALYVADFKDGKLTSSRVIPANAQVEVSPLRKRMVDALNTARGAFVTQKVTLCSKDRPNTVVLPPETPDGPILVYLLTPQPDLNTVSFGGNYRVEIAPDGTAGKVHAFAKSCIMSPINSVKGKSAMLFVTHLLDPTPTEIHVFESLVARLPVAVATTSNDYLWAVDGARIRQIEVLKKKPG